MTDSAPRLKREFFQSKEWEKLKASGDWRKRRGLPSAVRSFLKTYILVPEGAQTTDELEKAVGLFVFDIRSGWGKKGARTKKRKKAVRKRKLIRLAKRAHEKYRKERTLRLKKIAEEMNPSLFESLSVQYRPVHPNKPHRKVA